MKGVRNLLMAGLLMLTQAACADVYHEGTADRGRVITPAYFGVHFHRLAVRPHDKAVPTEWPDLQFGTVRVWDSGSAWFNVAQRPGEWNFAVLDAYVDTARARKATVLYTFGLTPRWASARRDEQCSYGQGCAAEPVRIAHWEEYVRRVAQRYGNRIFAYELWNEPKFSDIPRDRGARAFYSGSVDMMVELARVARKTLDEAAPEAALCTPGFVNGPDRLDMFLAAGGKNYVQAVCYHFYSLNSEHFLRQILEVRAVMKRHGLEHLPLWNTETGAEIHAVSEPSKGIVARTREQAIVQLSQWLILGAAAGLDRFDYYAWDNYNSGVVSRSGVRLFGYEEIRRVQTWLIGARLSGCASMDGVIACQGEREEKRFMLAWSEKSGKRTVNAPRGWRISRVEPLYGEPPWSSSTDRSDARIMELGPVPVRLALEPTNR